jgi:hypothetical protein
MFVPIKLYAQHVMPSEILMAKASITFVISPDDDNPGV